MNRSWYTNTINESSSDSIHQTLVFGTLDDIRSLKEKVGEKKLRELFLRYPKKIYTIPVLNFIKNFILHIHTSIDEQDYLKYTPRRTR